MRLIGSRAQTSQVSGGEGLAPNLVSPDPDTWTDLVGC